MSSKKSILSAVLVFQALLLAKVSHSFLKNRIKSFTFIITSVFPNMKRIIYEKKSLLGRQVYFVTELYANSTNLFKF